MYGPGQCKFGGYQTDSKQNTSRIQWNGELCCAGPGGGGGTRNRDAGEAQDLGPGRGAQEDPTEEAGGRDQRGDHPGDQSAAAARQHLHRQVRKGD